MNVRSVARHEAQGNTPEAGMDRFFSSKNLDRYRRLAADESDDIERNRLLFMLAEEWDVFTRECRVVSGKPVSAMTGECPSKLEFPMTRAANEVPDIAQTNHFFERPPIVLTTSDRGTLFALLRTARTTTEPGIARFLNEELERAEIVSGEVSETAFVSIGSTVKFVDDGGTDVREVTLVHPDEANGVDLVSATGGLGSALIGLGPGQTITWYDDGLERRTTVLETAKEPLR